MKCIEITSEQMNSHEFWIENPHGVEDLEGYFHYPFFGVELNGELITRHWKAKVRHPNDEVKDELLKANNFPVSVATAYAQLIGGKVVVTMVHSTHI